MLVEGRDLSSRQTQYVARDAGDWATYQLRRVFRNGRWRCTRKRRLKPAIACTRCTTRSAARTSCRTPGPSAAPTRAHRVWTARTSRISKRTACGGGSANWRLRSGTRSTDRTPIRRVFIPKANTTAKNPKFRPLGISTLRDRVCVTAAMLVLEPIFEAELPVERYAYRPGRNAQQAASEVKELLIRGHRKVVDADLADYLDRASYCPPLL